MPRPNPYDAVQRAIIESQPDASRTQAARLLLEERRRLLGQSASYGYALAGITVLLAVLMAALQNALLTGGLIYGAYFWYQIGSSFNLAQPRFVLLLRRFGPRAKKKDFILAKYLGRACRGLAIPATIQDRSFRGELPIFSQVIQQTLLFPAAALGMFVFVMLMPHSILMRFSENLGGAIVVIVGVAVYLALYVALRWAKVKRANERDYVAMLDRFVKKTHTRRFWTYSGTRVMKFPDTVWRQAVEFCLRAADAIVIDLSDISENVEWEIATAFRIVASQKIMLTWAVDNSEDDRTKLSQSLCERLLQIVPSGKFSGCWVRAYQKKEDLGASLYEEVFAADLALCLAGSNIHTAAV